MNNQEYQIKSSISKKEYYLISELKKSEKIVFSNLDVKFILNSNKKKIYNLLKNLAKKNLIKRIKKDKYILNVFSQPKDINLIATRVYWPSYISFWTALNFYKFTEQLPKIIYVVTTRQAKNINFEGYRFFFIKFTPKRFFGYRKIDNLQIADKEKSIVDSLLYPRYSGGIKEVAKCLYEGWNEMDQNKLLNYCFLVNNKSILQRLGYLIDRLSLKIAPKLRSTLQKNIGKGYVLLDPRIKKKNYYNSKWKINVNTNLEEV